MEENIKRALILTPKIIILGDKMYNLIENPNKRNERQSELIEALKNKIAMLKFQQRNYKELNPRFQEKIDELQRQLQSIKDKEERESRSSRFEKRYARIIRNGRSSHRKSGSNPS